MSGWRVLISGGASAIGALAFLTLVADEVDRVNQDLERWETLQRDELRRRLARGVIRGPSKTEDAA